LSLVAAAVEVELNLFKTELVKAAVVVKMEILELLEQVAQQVRLVVLMEEMP
jgi:hypothetical protein